MLNKRAGPNKRAGWTVFENNLIKGQAGYFLDWDRFAGEKCV